MTLSRALFTTNTDDWTTPPALFAALREHTDNDDTRGPS